MSLTHLRSPRLIDKINAKASLAAVEPKKAVKVNKVAKKKK